MASKTELRAKGKAIMAEAKKIRKSNPRMKWTSCVSKAAKQLKKSR